MKTGRWRATVGDGGRQRWAMVGGGGSAWLIRWWTIVVTVVACGWLASPAVAQSLADRISSVADGRVRISFAAGPGVCGNGRNVSTSGNSNDWESWCEPGPVRVVLTVQQRRVVDIDTYVGGRWRSAGQDVTDLGEVGAADAAAYFLRLGAAESGPVAKDAILPAVLADSAVVWPRLLSIARDESRPRDVRKNAVFWVGQAAEEAAVEGLTDLVEDSGDADVREHAVFALSQLPRDQGVPMLLQIARTHREPRIRKRAIFWLGQSDDPRALTLFEELLIRR